MLDCLHVGDPAPSIQWQHDGAAVLENSKYQVRQIGYHVIRSFSINLRNLLIQIFPNGSLSIHRLAESDQGDYTCGVQNMHGKDQISYEIIIQGMCVY